MITYYRISNNSYNKKRFEYWPNLKYHCFENFLKNVYRPTKNDKLIVIADKISDETADYLCDDKKKVWDPPYNVIRTNFGNGAASWRYAAEMAKLLLDDKEIVYFLEDDYLHLPGSREILIEGLEFGHYSSGYDHPDKYMREDGNCNPYVRVNGEITEVMLGQLSHWKVTNSTTMTFATTVKTLKEDWPIWDRHTQTTHPNDFGAFIDLYTIHHHVVTPIPGYSTHCESKWASPLIKWYDV